MVTKQDLLEVKNIIINDIKHFQMGAWKQVNDCGTAFCIGGWLHQKGKIVIPMDIRFEVTCGNMPDMSSDSRDSHSSLFNVDQWADFVSQDTLNYIVEVTENFDNSESCELEPYQIDELDDDIRIKLISMVIDDYIAVYYPEGEDNG